MYVKSSLIAPCLAALVAMAALGCTPVRNTSPRLGPASKMLVTFFDMPTHGQALAVQTPGGHTYLIDTGLKVESETYDYDPGRDTMMPFLGRHKITKIDGIVHSHSDGDHFGGSSYLLQNFKVDGLIDSGYAGVGVPDGYRKMLKLADDLGVKRQIVKKGATLRWDDALEVTVLSPPKGFLKPEKLPDPVHDLPNENCLVLRVRHGKNVFLFPGDIDRGFAHDYLLKTWDPQVLKATVMAAPHHGFGCLERLAAVARPELVVACCLKGYPNGRFRSPAQRTVEVYGPVGAKVYATAWHGTVQVISDGETYQVEIERQPASKEKKQNALLETLAVPPGTCIRTARPSSIPRKPW